MTASWKHIINFYEMDKNQSTGGDCLAPKLTDQHVYPDKLKKMKVSFAAQVFSQRVGAIMKRLSLFANNLNDGELMVDYKYFIILLKLYFYF